MYIEKGKNGYRKKGEGPWLFLLLIITILLVISMAL